ncbi:MAG: mRNA cleavage and polyadenylation factor subunit [Trichoglossum hirsutum]|nr:MAG: mRNA cleavage and polyadenylation factor subunit [Trichoglossum hirsutum]
MQCYTELTPPTAVTHALSLPFTSTTSADLIVAKTSLLQIFSLKTVLTEVDTGTDGKVSARGNTQLTDRRVLDNDGLEQSFIAADVILQRSERSHTTSLVLKAEYHLSGTVVSLARIRTLSSKTGADCLLVAFKDAKLSLVEWDPERYGISTISIHYYEREDLQGGPWAPDPRRCINYLTADPSSRCAALKFGKRNLAILPFRQAGDEDLAMDDYDPDLDGERPELSAATASRTNGDTSSPQTPYSSSFVLPLSALEPSLIHTVHLSFLYEYREPTFGILFSSLAPTPSLLYDRRDPLSYTVFTLDLEQRASTTILSVSGLPYDIYSVIPLPLPVGGALLVGGNELIHVDQAGRTNGVGVNVFARQCTSFSLADQSDLEMKLEACTIEQLGTENGDMLIVLNTGELAILGFKMDGRSVSGLSVRRVTPDHGGLLVQARASCAVNLGRGRIFIGSEDADSVILSWTRKAPQLARQRSIGGLSTDDDGDGEIFFDKDGTEEYDDDLYSGAASEPRRQSDGFPSAPGSAVGDYVFKINDTMRNIAPMKDVAFGRPSIPQDGEVGRNSEDITTDLELVITTSSGRAGAVTVLKREIEPKVIGRFEFPEAKGIWSVRAKRPIAGNIVPPNSEEGKMGLDGGYASGNEFDRFMIVSKGSTRTADKEESAVYALTATGFEDVKAPEFDGSLGGTIEVGTLGLETRVVQVLRGEVRVYDGGESITLLSHHSILRSNCASHPIHKEIPWIGFNGRPKNETPRLIWMRRTSASLYFSNALTCRKFTVNGESSIVHKFKMDCNGAIFVGWHWEIPRGNRFGFMSHKNNAILLPNIICLQKPLRVLLLAILLPCCLLSSFLLRKTRNGHANSTAVIDLSLSQIIPMFDDVTGAEPKIVSASFADPYLLLVRDDASILILVSDEGGEIEEFDKSEALLSTQWLSGCLYTDRDDMLGASKEGIRNSRRPDILMFLLTTEGCLQNLAWKIYNLPHLTAPFYVADTLSLLPPILSADYTVKRPLARETLTEILVADLGDAVAKSPYLILRSANDDLTIYHPFHFTKPGPPSSSTLRFLKLPNPQLAQDAVQETASGGQDRRHNPMRSISNIGGYSTVFLPGASPSFILKGAASTPRVLSLKGKAVRGMSGFNTGGCERGWVYVDVDGVVRVSQFKPNVTFAETGWSMQKVLLGEEVSAISYHATMGSYVLGTSEEVEFELPKDDDFRKNWATEDISFKPKVEHGFLKLLSPTNWSIVDIYPLEADEVPLCIRTLNLETSEHTHARTQLIVAGTAITRGEDLATRGCIYVFEIISVVPQPGRPETNRKLKLIAKEEVKGAVTALCEVGTQGFLLAAQGQKCMVRGLKEDGSLLPVAFMDMQCYVSVAKSLPGSGLIAFGDAVKNFWFAGFSVS